MTTTIESVSDLPPGGVARVDYLRYKELHPDSPSARELAEADPKARRLYIPANIAVRVTYSNYDCILLDSSAPAGGEK